MGDIRTYVAFGLCRRAPRIVVPFDPLAFWLLFFGPALPWDSISRFQRTGRSGRTHLFSRTARSCQVLRDHDATEPNRTHRAIDRIQSMRMRVLLFSPLFLPYFFFLSIFFSRKVNRIR